MVFGSAAPLQAAEMPLAWAHMESTTDHYTPRATAWARAQAQREGNHLHV